MSSRRPGRPRSEPARLAVLASTARLVERDGYGRVTIEAIARDAGVSKQTIYRWWPTKAVIILDALNEAATVIAPARDTGSLETDLRLFVQRSVAGARNNSPLLAALMAEAQRDAAFAESFRSEFLAHRRQVLRELLDRGQSSGELAVTADADFLAEIVFAALWYRILARNRPLNRQFANQLTDALLALAAPRPCGVTTRGGKARRP